MRTALFFFFFFPVLLLSAGIEEETLYLTWTNDPAHTMVVQWLSSDTQPQTLWLRSSEQEAWQPQKSFPLTSPRFPYVLHRVHLVKLQPKHSYSFKRGDTETPFLFFTAPDDGSPFTFVEGGDMYHDDVATMNATSRAAAIKEPLFAVIGGDIAYAVANSRSPQENGDRWITWIKEWHRTMRGQNRRLIPVIATIGNHDLVGQFDQTNKEAALFSFFFPREGSALYGTLSFPPLLTLFLLDSGHGTPIAGDQSQWLAQALEHARTAYKIAVYHVPAYPSVRSSAGRHTTEIRNAWVPLFEKHALTGAFEHHDHAYKRTHPLKRGKIDPSGVIYLGDGAWGIARPRSPRAPHEHYVAHAAARRHFFLTSISRDKIQFEAISPEGTAFDTLSVQPGFGVLRRSTTSFKPYCGDMISLGASARLVFAPLMNT